MVLDFCDIPFIVFCIMDKKSKYTREEILNVLRGDTVAYVKFVKSNGEARHMQCTRNPKHIPEAFSPKKESTESPEKIIKENLDIINAFDVEKKGWRSFRVDSVTEYGIENGYNK